MPDFSVIQQMPEVRAIVQENILERAFHDALFPRVLFRGEATPQIFPANVGDTMAFTGVGLIKTKQQALRPGADPLPSTYQYEQWTAQLQQWADSIDTHMPTSNVAIADLFKRNAHQMGLSAAQTLNRIARNKLYNASLAGHTVADQAQTGVTALRVKRLNGFTRARRPDLPSGSPVRFDIVSTNNPLAVKIYDQTGPAEVSRKVIGFTPDVAGDETGPGIITLNTAVTVLNRAYVVADNSTYLVRVGGSVNKSIDDLGSGDLLDLASVRTAVGRMWGMNVPEQPDGRFHCHLDPVAQGQIFADDEFQRLLTALPDMYYYKQFAVGEMLNTVFYRNSECPLPETVEGGLTGTFDQSDPFAGELKNASNIRVHRSLFVGHDFMYEYYQDLGSLITDAGIVGKVGSFSITNSGIEVFTSDRVQLIIRAPLNRLQDLVSTSWKFIGDFPVRTDVTTGDAAAYKRVVCVESGEAA